MLATRRTIVGLALVALSALAGRDVCGRDEAHRRAPALTFDGATQDLQATVVVPTLDTPLPARGSVVWCASFELAWRALARDVLKAPVRVKGAEDTAARLNAAPDPDLPPSAAFATAGRVTPPFLQGLRKEMRRRFPDAPAPSFEDLGRNGILAYAYLAANVRFAIPFFREEMGLGFSGEDGETTRVEAFGLRDKDDYAYYELRKQVDVLHAEHMYESDAAQAEFVVDPDRTSKPFQLLLARIEREDTLAATLESMQAKIEATAEREYRPSFGPNDTLLVPDLRWRLAHRFRELEGRDRTLLNAGFEGYWIERAMQTIELRLDKSGADLKSEAKLYCAPVPAHFRFDRPFLIVMRRRGDVRPFFAMWVANPELLVRRAG